MRPRTEFDGALTVAVVYTVLLPLIFILWGWAQ